MGPEVVTATFYNFAPAFVARRVPAIWSATTPEAALQARLDGIDRAVRRILGEEWPASAEAAEAANLAATAAAAVDLPGRPLAAANRACPRRPSRISPCGSRSPRCANTGATGTTPPC